MIRKMATAIYPCVVLLLCFAPYSCYDSLTHVGSDTTTKVRGSTIQTNKLSFEDCDLCQPIHGKIKTIATQYITKNVMLKRFCGKLANISDCHQYHTTFLKAIQGSLLDSSLHCELSTNCSQNFLQERKVKGNIHFVAEETKVGDDAKCVLCEFFMKKIDDWLKQNMTEEEMKQYIDKACETYIKSPTVCNIFAKVVMMAINRIISGQLSPKQACVSAGMCPAPVLIQSTNGSIACHLCQHFVNVMDDIIYRDLPYIKKYVLTLCKDLDNPYQKECLDFADKKLYQMILNILQTTLSPQTVCKGLCIA